LEKAVAADEPDAFYFLARCYGWDDGNDQKAVAAGELSASKELLRFRKTLFGKWKRKDN